MMKGVCPGSVLEVWKLEPPKKPVDGLFQQGKECLWVLRNDIEETKTSEGWQR